MVRLTASRHIYFCAIAFTAIALVGSFFLKDVSGNMTDNVAITLTNDKRSGKRKKVPEV
jgi:hypothetical protein